MRKHNAKLTPFVSSEEVVGQIRSATNGNYALGSERFQREIEATLGRRASRG